MAKSKRYFSFGLVPLTIREADRTERIPVIQAILRKVAVAAANGNIRAQQNYLNLLIGAEAERRMATMELFTTAVEYKEHWGRVLAERARSGATGPEPVPHPDDIIIDPKTGEVRFDGPVSEQQWMAGERLRAMWPELRRMLRQVDEKLKSDPKNSELVTRQRELTKWIDWLMKDAGRRAMRDALIPAALTFDSAGLRKQALM